MEGRYPPPPADHPFPKRINYKKFWNTPLAPAYIKTFITIMGTYAVLVGVHTYIRRDDHTLVGIDFYVPEEDARRRREIKEQNSELSLLGLPIGFKQRDNSKTADLRFDDGVSFRPPDLEK